LIAGGRRAQGWLEQSDRSEIGLLKMNRRDREESAVAVDGGDALQASERAGIGVSGGWKGESKEV